MKLDKEREKSLIERIYKVEKHLRLANHYLRGVRAILKLEVEK